MHTSLTERLSKGWEIRTDRLVPWAIGFYTPSFCFPSPTGFLLSGTMCFVAWQILWVSQKCVSTSRVKCRFLSRSAKPEVQDELTFSFSYSILPLKSDVLLWLIAFIRAIPWHRGYEHAFLRLPAGWSQFLPRLQWPKTLFRSILHLWCCGEAAGYITCGYQGSSQPALCYRLCCRRWARTRCHSGWLCKPACPTGMVTCWQQAK